MRYLITERSFRGSALFSCKGSFFCFRNRSSEKFPLNQKNVEFFPGHFPAIMKLQRNEAEENVENMKGWNHEKETAVIGKQHFWRSEIERGYDYEDIVDEHFPPEIITKELADGEFGLPANKTVSDRVSSYVEFLADSGFTRGSQLFREINSKGIYECTGEEK